MSIAAADAPIIAVVDAPLCISVPPPTKAYIDTCMILSMMLPLCWVWPTHTHTHTHTHTDAVPIRTTMEDVVALVLNTLMMMRKSSIPRITLAARMKNPPPSRKSKQSAAVLTRTAKMRIVNLKAPKVSHTTLAIWHRVGCFLLCNAKPDNVLCETGVPALSDLS